MRHALALALALGPVALFACGSDDPSADEPCTPGQQRSCKCDNGAPGAQKCEPSGERYDECFGCAGSGSGGGGGSGGTASGGAGGASGGSAGSGGGGGGKRSGLVKLDGRSLSDDQGRFNALGATLFWAAWGYKFDKPKLEQALDWLAKHGYHYFRALGVVGDPVAADFWDGREIDWKWPDYADVIAGLTDLAYDKYGLRVEWTLIGDGQLNIPNSADRYALVDTFVTMSQSRQQKIIHFEIANEAWQNGFEGSAGLTELRALAQTMKDKTEILVAASAPYSGDCAGVQEMTTGGVVDLTTVHFDRDIGQVEGGWRPVWQPWWLLDCQPGVPVGSNNEPIGPGSSVNTENDPLKLAASAASTWVSGLPLHVFHSKAGVRGDENIWDMSGADAFTNLLPLVPGDLASWDRKDPKQGDAPFRIHAGDGGSLVPDKTWTEVGNPTSGVVRAYGAMSGKAFFVLPIGIKGTATIEARAAASFDVYSLLTGQKLSSHTLNAGEQLTLSDAEAVVLKGSQS